MGSEYISRKILDAYFDRFTLKIIRIHERMAKIIAKYDNEIETIYDTIVGVKAEICDLVESSNDDCRRLDILDIKVRGGHYAPGPEATKG